MTFLPVRSVPIHHHVHVHLHRSVALTPPALHCSRIASLTSITALYSTALITVVRSERVRHRISRLPTYQYSFPSIPTSTALLLAFILLSLHIYVFSVTALSVTLSLSILALLYCAYHCIALLPNLRASASTKTSKSLTFSLSHFTQR